MFWASLHFSSSLFLGIQHSSFFFYFSGWIPPSITFISLPPPYYSLSLDARAKRKRSDIPPTHSSQENDSRHVVLFLFIFALVFLVPSRARKTPQRNEDKEYEMIGEKIDKWKRLRDGWILVPFLRFLPSVSSLPILS